MFAFLLYLLLCSLTEGRLLNFLKIKVGVKGNGCCNDQFKKKD